MPMPPAPHYDTQTHQYDGEPGVEEVVASKNAGSMSFAHYIVRWVSECLLSFIFPNSMIHAEFSRSFIPLTARSTSLFHTYTNKRLTQRRAPSNSMLHHKSRLPNSGCCSLRVFLHKKYKNVLQSEGKIKISSLFFIDFLPKSAEFDAWSSLKCIHIAA